MKQARRRQVVFAACGLFAVPLLSHAQRAGRVARVGWLGWTGAEGAAPAAATLEAFRSGLFDQGWKEGENLVIEVRHGDRDRARELTQELLRSTVDVLVAQGPMVFAARAVAGATPIISSIDGDPVEAKLAASLARPGANLTGITALSTELAEKRLELLKEALPRARRIAAIANQAHPGVQTEQRASQAAAQRLGVTLQWIPVYAVNDFGPAFDAIGRDGADALAAIPDVLINQQARPIAEFAVRRKIPSISGWAEFAEAGNLMSYGPNLRGFYRHIAVYVDKLLRGARPAGLPIEQPTELEFVVNRKAARALGISVPQSVLLRADRVIE